MIPHIKQLNKVVDSQKAAVCSAVVSAQVHDLELGTVLHTQLHVLLQSTEREHQGTEPKQEVSTGNEGLVIQTLILPVGSCFIYSLTLYSHIKKTLKPNKTLKFNGEIIHFQLFQHTGCIFSLILTS